MELTTILARGEDYVFNEVDGELVMMNIENGSYASMNDTGKSIWGLIEEPKTVDEVLTALIVEYDIDRQTAETEVISFIKKLVKVKVITIS
jgi:hypothetical protein